MSALGIVLLTIYTISVFGNFYMIINLISRNLLPKTEVQTGLWASLVPVLNTAIFLSFFLENTRK